MHNYLFTSESVGKGHPDKMCDQISDAILDEILLNDSNAKVACETLATTGAILVTGQITTDCYVDISKLVRNTILDIGYNNPKYGFDGNTCAVMTTIDAQSADIASGVDSSYEYKQGQDDKYNLIGAGDQGLMFGFACDETSNFMPLPIYLAHKLVQKLDAIRGNRNLDYLRPDAKSQVTVEYENNKAKRIDTVVISVQHDENISINELKFDIIDKVIKPVIGEDLIDSETKFYINPTGRFVVGGPVADTGLTGRKIAVDTYGGFSRHGGGAFSGKDPTKVDRSASYAARYIAKNIVAAGLASKCEIQIAYAIGVAAPVSLHVETFGTSKVDPQKLLNAVKNIFDLRPMAIIDKLNLRKPIYKNLAVYGHMGREDLDVTWEKLDQVKNLLDYLN